MTAAVGPLVAVPLSWPVRRAVTLTVILLPRSADFRVSADAVAPAIVLPSAYHWYRYEDGAGDHAPGAAVSFRPTFAVPGVEEHRNGNRR
ncbi:hypothetical protein BB341_29190 (plasmid) [Streptomyces clavuligerus]|nr:hypothetical protein BB341_29190 [Streptomyces clavuligerus]AXU17304.1 hypothetical protein D1794_32315 [Streptomyces clavuligerus]EDY47542.1 hypothetical protein SSCG_00570 [Streptomyces clavuligerus]QCS10373.1 hypothetical protein CRV15_33020 [Streptomyces clavuligerus]